jgi:hypothetical protein
MQLITIKTYAAIIIMAGPSVSIVLMEFEIIIFVDEVLDDDNCGGM